MSQGQPALELFQFAHSHYNEKARWALDLKGIAHTRRTLLPGPHMPIVKRVTGRTRTPAVRFANGESTDDSTRIIEALEARWPEPALLPRDPAARQRVLAIVKELDDELGPATRRLFWSLVRDDRDYVARLFGGEAHPVARRTYQVALRVIVGKVAQLYDLSKEAVADSRGVVQRWFERIATQSEKTGYLVGREFTLADLSAAALSMPVLPQMPNAARLPDRVLPEPLAKYVEGWDDHPSRAWFIDIYTKHRPADGTARVA